MLSYYHDTEIEDEWLETWIEREQRGNQEEESNEDKCQYIKRSNYSVVHGKSSNLGKWIKKTPVVSVNILKQP